MIEDKYFKILRAYNIAALFISLFFAIFLSVFVDYSKFWWIFIATSAIYLINIWVIGRGLYLLAYLLYMGSNCALLLIFDAGIYSPAQSYIFYIPLILSNFIIIDPEKVGYRILALGLTFFCIISTTFLDYTPKLASHLIKPEHQEFVTYVNFIAALAMTLIMMEIIVKNSNKVQSTLIENQKNLILKEQLLHSINQNISEGIYRSTEDNRLIYINNAFANLFGYDAVEEVLTLRSPFLYKEPLDREKLVELIKEQGYFTNQEIQFVKKDGTLFWGLISSILSSDDNGNQFFDGAIRDITQFKKIEEEMLLAKNEAEQASLAKSKFLSAMSHEIRTPMNAVIGISNILLMNDKRDKQEQENLLVLKSSAQNLMSLLNDLLDFSKIESGKFELQPVFVDLKFSLEDLISMYEFYAKEKGIQFILDIQIDPYLLKLDVIRLKQVLSNLLSNAVKFTSHGFVKLSVTTNLIDQNSCALHFSVSDSGIGIESEQQQNIFKAFAQADENIASLYGGSGLGLAISKNILLKMESEFEVFSEKNKGSTFSFNITSLYQKPPENDSLTPHLIGENNLSGFNVLLVEDNQVNIAILKQLLLKWAISVDVAINGELALELAVKNPYNLILMDLHMPRMNGIEATRQIRKSGIQSPIIALTADAISESKEECLSAGMNDFITKPFNPDELFRKLYYYKSRQ